jgi:hypothetical protein
MVVAVPGQGTTRARGAAGGAGLALAAVLHGLYDRFADSWGGTVIAVLIVTTFLGYVRAVEEICDLLAPAAPSPLPAAPPVAQPPAASWPASF